MIIYFKKKLLSSCLFLLLSVLVVTLVDINQYKNEISQFVKDESGLDLEINGDLYLSFFSGIKIEANDIKLSHNRNIIVHIDSIVLGGSLASLYNNKHGLTSLNISIKQLNLITDKKGKFDFLDTSKHLLNKSEKLNDYGLKVLRIKSILSQPLMLLT